MDDDAIVRELLRKNRRRWPGVLLAIVLLFAAAFGIVRYTLHHRVVVELERIRADGYPTTLAELDAWYLTPSGANAADVYLEAFDAYVKDEALETLLPGFNTNLDWPAPDEPMSAEMHAAMDAYVTKNAAALALLVEAIPIPDCRYPLDLTEGYLLSLSHLSEMKKGVNLLAMHAAVAVDRGQIESVVESIKASVALAASLKHEPVLISCLVRISIRTRACRTVEHVLGRGAWTDAQLADLARHFEGTIDDGAIVRTMIGERASTLSAIDMLMPSRGRAALGSITGLTNAERSAYLGIMREVIKKAEDPLGHPVDTDAMIRDLPWYYNMVREVVPAMDGVFRTVLRADATTQTLLVALAAKRYELAHGKFPARLDELVPTYLDAVPVDPFDGKPLRYKLTDTGAVIYSIGRDGTDDGGSETNAQGQAYGDGIDIIFTLRR